MQHTPIAIKRILKEVAEEFNVDYLLVEEIYYHQFEFLRDAMEEGKKGEVDTFNNILLKHFGTFYVNKNRIEKLNEIQRSKNISRGGSSSDTENRESRENIDNNIC